MNIQKSIDINAKPESVWPFLVEPEKVMQWCITFRKFEYTGDQRSGVGTPLFIEEHTGGMTSKMHFEISEWQETKKLALKMISGSMLKEYQQWWTVEASNGGSTFTFAEEIVLPLGIVGRALSKLMTGVSSANIDKMLVALKEQAESTSK